MKRLSVSRSALTSVAAAAMLAVVGLASPWAWARPPGQGVKPPAKPTDRPRPSNGLAHQTAGVTSLAIPQPVVSTQSTVVTPVSSDP